MRLGKRERRALKELKRRARAVQQRAEQVKGQPIRGSLSTVIPSAGTSKPGANLLRFPTTKDKPAYSIEAAPRLSSHPKKSQQVKRFSNA